MQKISRNENSSNNCNRKQINVPNKMPCSAEESYSAQLYQNSIDKYRSQQEIYCRKILKYLMQKDQKENQFENSFEIQNEINKKMRQILIDWLIEVCDKFQISQKSIYISINLIDNFLTKQSVKRKEFQLLGSTCLFIVAKQEEIYPPQLQHFISVCDNAYSQEQFLQMEFEILTTLNFQILTVNCYEFFLNLSTLEEIPEEAYYFILYIMETSLLCFNVRKYSQVNIVLSAVFLASKIFNFKNKFLSEQKYLSDYQIKICARDIYFMMKEEEESNLTSIKLKYAQEEYKEISKYKIEKKNLQLIT